jgi:tetratricopeptide (TPR) repeat protein
MGEAKTLRSQRKHDEAITLLEGMSEDTSPRDRALITGLIARIHRSAGRLDKSIAGLKEAIALHQSAGNLSGEIWDVTVLVYFLIENRIDLPLARQLLKTIAAHLPYHSHSAWRVAYHHGLLATYVGDNRRALPHLRHAVDAANRAGDNRLRSYAKQELAHTLETTGQLTEAIEVLSEEMASLPEKGAACDRLFLFNNFAWLNLISLEWEQAHSGSSSAPSIDISEVTRLLESAITIGQKECRHFRDQEINTYLNLAFCHFHRNAMPEATAALARARSVEKRFNHPYLELWALDIEARIAARSNHEDTALERYKAMHRAALRAADPGGRWRALAGQATTLDSMGQRELAHQHFARAEALMGEDSLLIPLHGGRDALLSKRGYVTQRYVASLLKSHEPERALQVIRQTRSRYLREMRMADMMSHLDAKTELDWQAAMSLYKGKRSELENLVADAWSVPKNELKDYEARKTRLETESREALDVALAIANLTPTKDSRATAKALRSPANGQLYLLFYELDDGWVGFAQSSTTLVWKTLGTIHFDTSSPEVLGHTLLQPFLSEIRKASEIVLMPWGQSRRIDIHALPVAGKPLIAHSPTVYSLDLPQRAPIANRSNILVVSDPRGDLPRAREEGAKITTILSHEASSAVNHITGSSATKESLTSQFANTEFFHYAGHGSFEGSRGWSSALPLANDSELNLSDILALPNSPRYVVLTGCETARSDTNVELESIGLAQAFVLSGSEGVVAATRPIRDELGMAVAESLYAELRRGTPLEPSLQKALLEVAKNSPESDWPSFRILKP